MRGQPSLPGAYADDAPGPARRVILICTLAILVVSQTMFLWNIDQPARLYFDEVHYVPAALALVHGQSPINIEHPPLAKWLMGMSISAFGDNPFGWRYASALFGSLGLIGAYLWGLALFNDNRPALWATAAVMLNQVYYVQSRIAMLDIFALAFCVWGLAAFTAAWTRRHGARPTALFIAAGVCFGLSAACKWTGASALAMVMAIVAAAKARQLWRTSFPAPERVDPHRGGLWRELTGWEWLAVLIVAPALAYYLSFATLGWDALSPANFFAAQARMWLDDTSLDVAHRYSSGWPSWPFLLRPIWYLFDADRWGVGAASARAIVYLGNPILIWGGLLAMAATFVAWLRERRVEAFLIVASFTAMWLCWAVIPRHLSFAFYYLPAATTLSFALAYVFYRTRLARWPWLRRVFLLLALCLFVYFLPISNAAMPISQAGFNSLMWLNSWR